MGGNAFEDVQKLTPQEYQTITKELLQLVSPICRRVEPYIPLPQKEVHGDIDFLIVFKPGFNLTNIIELLKLKKEEYILNNNLTANTVYRRKQVDFNAVADDHEFELTKFYKSYGGIGAFLGLLLPSKLVKYSEEGIFCCWYQTHHKLEFKVCDEVPQIMQFYGLDAHRYALGFTTRQQLFQFLLPARFLNPQEFKQKKPKWTTKLIVSFMEFLHKSPETQNSFCQRWEDPVATTLKYFKKQKEFEAAWEAKVAIEEKKKQRTQKWNGKHIMQVFGVESKLVNSLKKKFEIYLGGPQQVDSFIDDNPFEEIISTFAKACNINPVA